MKMQEMHCSIELSVIMLNVTAPKTKKKEFQIFLAGKVVRNKDSSLHSNSNASIPKNRT
jgi:hypothetical protein